MRVEWCRLSTSPAAPTDRSTSVTPTTFLRENKPTTKDMVRYTATRRPVRIIYSEQFPSIKSAMARERQLKGWTTTKKEALVGKDTARLKGVSSRSRRQRK